MIQRDPDPREGQAPAAELGGGSQSQEMGLAEGAKLRPRELGVAVERAVALRQLERVYCAANLRDDRVVRERGKVGAQRPSVW